MNNLTSDWVAIDTNVFEHVLDNRVNHDNHIDKLLRRLAEDEISLLVDCNGTIEGQYARRIRPKFTKASLTDNALYVFRLYFGGTHHSLRKQVAVDPNDDLMTVIKRILRTTERVDRLMVYVAFKENRILITNDKKDIVVGHSKKKNGRRGELKQKTKKARKKIRGRAKDKSDILTSDDAFQKL
ncbi:MAG: hypothetical protein MPK34_01440 [Gammaproteobacteria bacterium]|nr:hypothetical protein [Gammaproteobacteria bacterium]MDA7961077.1 hypothetical protein [Gammaproteobacteria bacterium]MDA8023202.1 hypothetical protein [Gammaproteobacteria bacterium]